MVNIFQNNLGIGFLTKGNSDRNLYVTHLSSGQTCRYLVRKDWIAVDILGFRMIVTILISLDPRRMHNLYWLV